MNHPRCVHTSAHNLLTQRVVLRVQEPCTAHHWFARVWGSIQGMLIGNAFRGYTGAVGCASSAIIHSRVDTPPSSPCRALSLVHLHDHLQCLSSCLHSPPLHVSQHVLYFCTTLAISLVARCVAFPPPTPLLRVLRPIPFGDVVILGWFAWGREAGAQPVLLINACRSCFTHRPTVALCHLLSSPQKHRQPLPEPVRQ